MIDAALAKRIRLVGLDVDGVLTDGGIYLGDAEGARVELKRYDIQDGLGIRFLRDAGLKVVIVTGRVSESVRMRAIELELDDVVQDAAARKLPAFRQLLERHSVRAEDAAFVGDDFPDAGVMREVGLPVAVGNAVPEIRAMAKLRLARDGGRGAVREFAEVLLKARGQWEEITERYVRERSHVPKGAIA
ncbi:MAG TPA: HAD hydrolase family protein [Gemmatimonadaceae bacterium]|nr:HAD hydrolase family protein [Gemmatimonadaceae bacterium]